MKIMMAAIDTFLRILMCVCDLFRESVTSTCHRRRKRGGGGGGGAGGAAPTNNLRGGQQSL